MNIETIKEVLQAWDAYNNASDSQEDAKAHSSMVVAFSKLRTAIEQAEKQEPVAWMDASETECLRKLRGFWNERRHYQAGSRGWSVSFGRR